MNKRGFGIVQIASIILIAIATLVFFILIVIQPDNPTSLEEGKEFDIAQVYADVVLDNILASPLNNPPEKLSKMFEEPTVVDLLIFMEDETLLENEVKPILDSLDHFRSTKTLYTLSAGNATITNGRAQADGKESTITFCNRGRDPTKSPQMTAQKIIRKANEHEIVQLTICESRQAK